MYAALKHSHMLFIGISIILFQYRYYLKFRHKSIAKLLKIVPHINDTLLLITGVTLAVKVGYDPMQHTWLMAKIIALVIYIGFGVVAMRAKGMKSVTAYLLATLTFIFILMTAFNKSIFLFNI